jgi:5-methylthioribose kinase
MARLLVGRTPAGTKEIVYNSYRAVDDKKERAWIDTIEAKGVDKMWSEYQKAKDKPVTLDEEMEMFRMLFKSAAAYDLNTVLQNDKAIGSKMEAVSKTMQIIVKALDNTREDFRYTIKDYAKLL